MARRCASTTTSASSRSQAKVDPGLKPGQVVVYHGWEPFQFKGAQVAPGADPEPPESDPARRRLLPPAANGDDAAARWERPGDPGGHREGRHFPKALIRHSGSALATIRRLQVVARGVR